MRNYFPKSHRPGLFRGDAWLIAWREAWDDCADIFSLNATAAYELPLVHCSYGFTQKLKSFYPVTTAFPLGVSTVAAPSIRSEYFDAAGLQQSIEQIVSQSWDQFYLPDVVLVSDDYDVVLAVARQNRLYVYKKDFHTSYAVNLCVGNFEAYLSSLGQGTRSRIYHRRKTLSQIGTITVENYWPDQEAFYDLLNQFHLARWGKPCYQGRNKIFITTLLNKLAEAGCSIDLSVMSVGGKPVSVALDIICDGRQYNLQSGYLQHFAKNISLGKLHFGFQLEHAFKNPAADIYDFMIGHGKNANYKSSLANCHAELVSLLLVRNPLLKLAYQFKSLLRSLRFKS